MNPAREMLLEKAQEVDAAARVPSPCLSICRMDAATEVCQGCWRTLEEIAEWGMASEERKRAIWKLLVRRAGQA